MVRDKYAVRLATEQREELQHLIRVGKSSARVTARARILLKSDDGWAAPQVAEALDVALGAVYRIKQRFTQEGLAGSLWDRGQANWHRKLDDRGEAHLTGQNQELSLLPSLWHCNRALTFPRRATPTRGEGVALPAKNRVRRMHLSYRKVHLLYSRTRRSTSLSKARLSMAAALPSLPGIPQSVNENITLGIPLGHLSWLASFNCITK